MTAKKLLGMVLPLFAVLPASAQTLDLSPEQWAEDIAYFDTYIREHHPNPFDKADEAEWNAEIEALRAGIASLPPAHIPIRFQRVMALLQDGHSYVDWRASAKLHEMAPIRLKRFSDGIFVVDQFNGESDLVRGRVTAVGDVPVDALIEKLDAYACDDNAYARADAMPWYLVQRACLELVGACEPGQPMRYTFETPGGAERSAALDAMPLPDWLTAYEAEPFPNVAHPPLYQQRPGDIYWHTILPDTGGLYAKFAAVQGQRGYPFVFWVRDMLEDAEKHDVPYIVIDVRLNGGGNGNMLWSLVEGLAESKWGQEEGRLYVITSPTTFSAAMMFVTRIERATKVQFAGQPAGGRPNHYGDNEPFELPNSKIPFRLSSLYHEESDPDDVREFQDVDVPVGISSEDYFAGRDPVLAAIARDGGR